MKVTLTFDNGPWPGVTEQVLDTLADRGLRSTFFVVGTQLARHRALAERAAAEGHWIGNHTMTHSVPLGDGADPVAEIDATQELIGPLGHPARWFRPFGRGGVLDEHLFSATSVAHLERCGYSCVLWNSVPRDWEDPDAWIDIALADVDSNEWTVVVLHDLPTGAMDRLPRFIDELEARSAHIVQDFPGVVVPIRDGRVVGDLAGLVSPAASAT
ncbi:MAG TPA: polysaccharide deacetylase family protein [Acidimicrobiales bacterium]|nr:polysaccharide deacetylase family protein [Acidimicrobiales bacterium]